MKKFSYLLIFFFLFTSSYCFAQEWEWVFGTRGYDFDYSAATAVDSSGNIYTCGYYNSSNFSVGGENLPNRGLSDFFIAKFNTIGNLLWVQGFGGEGNDIVTAIEVDKNNNVVVCGYYESSKIDFGDISLTNNGGTDFFVLKFDTDGNIIWAKNFGENSYEEATGLAIDLEGNIVVAGSFYGQTLSFGEIKIINRGAFQGMSDIFVSKLNPQGEAIWAKGFGGSSFDSPSDVAIDANSNVYLTGSFNSNYIVFGTDSLYNHGFSDVFVAKLSSDGFPVWAVAGNGTNNDWLNSIALDNEGNVYVLGEVQSNEFTFAGRKITTNGSYDVFVGKLSNNGTLLWAKSYGNVSDEYGKSITYWNGSLFICGHFASREVDFDGIILHNYTNDDYFADVYVAEMNLDGIFKWARKAGGNKNDFCSSIIVNENGMVYALGRFESKDIYFKQGLSLYNPGYSSIFLAKLNTKLNYVETSKHNDFNLFYFDNIVKITFEKNVSLYELTIYNILGKKVLSQAINGNCFEMNLSGLKSGVYYVWLSDFSFPIIIY